MGNFNKDFVYAGIFPKEISRAQEVRLASDYYDFYVVSVEDAKEKMKTAEEVVDMAEKYLNVL